MWAIRIAYTHGNGQLNQISDLGIADFLNPNFAVRHLRGVRVDNDIVKVFGDVTYPAIKTVLEINDKFS